MSKREITMIPATIPKFAGKNARPGQKRRVAAYARVSTDMEEQLTSYEAQMDYYTKYIMGRADWQFAGLYSDEGISGTPDTKGVSVTFWVGSEYCGCIFNRSSPKTNGFLTAEGGIKGASEMGLQLRKLKKPAIQGFSQ